MVINWSGYQWSVKAGTGLGPGPNNWSDNPNDVFVDTQGKLHLRITNYGGVWYCTEIVSLDTFGYGTYIFNVDTTSLDSNAVLGMFTYLNDQNEIDIEFSQWGNPNDQNNAGFTVQPLSGTYNQYNTRRFYTPLNYSSQNKFTWTSSNVTFSNNTLLQSNQWNTDSSVTHIPQTSSEKVHLNLWLYQGQPPSNNQQQEVVISNFKYEPLSSISNYLIYGSVAVILLLILRK